MKISSPQTEFAILRAMTQSKKIAAKVINATDTDYFSMEESNELLQYFKKHYAKYEDIPNLRSVVEDPSISKDARSFLKSAKKYSDPNDVDADIKNLGKYRQLRLINEIATNLANKINSGSVKIDETLDYINKQVTNARLSKTLKESNLHFGKNNNSQKIVDQIIDSDDTSHVIPTGIEAFDSKAGGLVRGSLVTIGATSGSGKSLMVIHLAMFMASLGYRVGVVPLEMSKVEMTSRIIAALARLDVTNVLQHKLAKGERALAHEKYEKWIRKIKKNGGRLSIIKPEEDVGIEEIFAIANPIGLDVLIVDYISLLKGVDGDDAWAKLGAVARTAKINAENTNRINILVCQVNDDLKIRYARSISEHSTNSFVWTAKKEDREKEIGRIRIEQPKSRNNRSYPFDVGFNWANMRIQSIEPEKVQHADSIKDRAAS